MNYEVKNVKGFMGEDCPGYNATLYRDGQKVALVIDSGNGGEVDFQWVDWKATHVDINWKNDDGKDVTFKGTPEEALFHSVIVGQKWFWEGKEMGQKSTASYMAEMVGAFENDRRFKRLCKNQTLFHVKGDETGSYRVVKAVFSKRIKDFIVTKYGDQVEIILNEKYGQIAA